MGEIIVFKLLLIIVTVTIIVCYLIKVTQDAKKIEECKNLWKIKEIEMWLTKVNAEEISVRATGELPAEDVCAAPPQVDGCNIVNLPNYRKFPFVEDTNQAEENNNTDEGSFTKWHVKATHQAAKLLKENKDILETHNKTALRLLHLYSIAGALYHSELQKRKELRKSNDDMRKIFFETIHNKSKITRHRPREYKLDLKPQSCSVLKCIWESWHMEVGTAARDNFKKMVELSNEAAKENGYKDTGEVWRIYDVEDTNAEEEMKRLLDGVMPLYEQLHAYVRRKIVNHYSNVVYCRDPPKPEDLIPAHLTGNLIGNGWSQLESMVLPYPEVTPPDFSEFMNSLNLDQNDMAREAEKFFISLGFRPMPDEFWHNSTFKSTGDPTFGCSPTLYDDFDGSGYRAFVCANLVLNDFVVLHRVMGYVASRMESEHLPYKFRFGLSKIIVDALGDSLALSVTTPDHLKMIFNVSKGDWNNETKNVSEMEFVTEEAPNEQTVTEEVTSKVPVPEEQNGKATPTEQEAMVTDSPATTEEFPASNEQIWDKEVYPTETVEQELVVIIPPATNVSAMEFVTKKAPKEQTVTEEVITEVPVTEEKKDEATPTEQEAMVTEHPASNVSAMEFVTKEAPKEQTVTEEVTTEVPVTEEKKEEVTPTEQEAMITEPPASSEEFPVSEKKIQEEEVAPVEPVEQKIVVTKPPATNVSAMEVVTEEAPKEQTVTEKVTAKVSVAEAQEEKAEPVERGEQNVLDTTPPATSEEFPKKQVREEMVAPITTAEQEIVFKHPAIKRDLNEKLDDGGMLQNDSKAQLVTEQAQKEQTASEAVTAEVLIQKEEEENSTSIQTVEEKTMVSESPGTKCDQNERSYDEEMLKKRDINALMRSALLMLPLLPYSYVLETWRYRVFSRKITPEEYNKSWWNMRAKYQGIVPPVQRSDCNFDPGAIFHISLNVPYGNNFFSLFVAYQIHETLCKLSKHEGPLHHCDIYQSKDAGQKLRDILKQGGSKPTVELLKELTCGDGYRYEPILKYYEPLHDWLKEQNEGHTVKWNENLNTE